MEQPQYIVDAFTDAIFSGNPAAVCPLNDWLPDTMMAATARENNLSETAFIVGTRGAYAIRWFTPSMEVDLCGHETLASAFVVFNYLEPNQTAVSFQSPSGPLHVKRRDNLFVLDFPARPGDAVKCPPAIVEGLGVSPLATFFARDYLVIFGSHEQVAQCKPVWPLLQDLPSLGIIISAPGTDCDFASRVFFPTDSIVEDPVTGSAHRTLIPYWSARLGKRQLHARQISNRGGKLFCEMAGERVYIGGHAALFSKARIFV